MVSNPVRKMNERAYKIIIRGQCATQNYPVYLTNIKDMAACLLRH